MRILRTAVTITLGSLLALLIAAAVFAQKPAAQRTILTQADISVPGREAIVVRVVLPVGASVGRHTHPGEEITDVLEGEGEILIDGQPPKKVKAGDAFIIPAGAVHDARNGGNVPLRLSIVYVVEKGKPISTPAP